MDGRVERSRRDGLFVDNFVDDRGDVLTWKWLFSGHQFVEDHAKGKNVRAAVNWFALHLFRRHVGGRSHDVCRLRCAKLKNLCGTEIGDLDDVVRSQHEVRGFDVAVHDIMLVREIQRGANLFHQLQDARYGKGL